MLNDMDICGGICGVPSILLASLPCPPEYYLIFLQLQAIYHHHTIREYIRTIRTLCTTQLDNRLCLVLRAVVAPTTNCYTFHIFCVPVTSVTRTHTMSETDFIYNYDPQSEIPLLLQQTTDECTTTSVLLVLLQYDCGRHRRCHAPTNPLVLDTHIRTLVSASITRHIGHLINNCHDWIMGWQKLQSELTHQLTYVMSSIPVISGSITGSLTTFNIDIPYHHPNLNDRLLPYRDILSQKHILHNQNTPLVHIGVKRKRDNNSPNNMTTPATPTYIKSHRNDI